VADDVKSTRGYASPHRRRQAQATAQAILDAAQTLFERDGFASTSMAAIAQSAGVSQKTVYLHFDTKARLLRELWNTRLRGASDGVPVGEQPWFRAVLDEPDPERQLRLNTRNSRTVKERAAALLAVIREAAPTDPEIGTLWSRIQTEFHANQLKVAESLAAKGALRPPLDAAAAADILWSLNDPYLFDALTTTRKWSADRYEQWLGDLLCEQLLA
jgi:AcrR family transcriptional regulator